MNPLTDKLTPGFLNGEPVEIFQPGALAKTSRNWRLTQQAYENYSSHLRLGIENYEQGNETSFEVPSNVSPNTFAARFRDAKQALLLYGYDPLLQQRLISLGNVAVSMDPDGKKIWFRARHQPGREIKATIDQVKRPLATTQVIEDMPATIEELDALCLLIHKGRIAGPMFFRGEVHADRVTELTTKFDIAFVFDPETNTTTLI